jgi:hypothetical protein
MLDHNNLPRVRRTFTTSSQSFQLINFAACFN